MIKAIEEGQSYTDLPIKGMTFSKVYSKTDEIFFETKEGRIFKLYHDQDCCESVSIDDIVGELDSLVGYPLEVAEEASFSGTSHDSDSFTWTFYRFRTVIGSVLVKWYGSSNGYYSEGVTGKWINELEKKKKELEALIEQLENKQDIEGIEKMFPGHPELVKFLYEETSYPEDLSYFDWDDGDAGYYIEREEDKFVLHETHNIGNDIEIYFNNTFDVDELSEYVLNADLQSEVEIKLIHKIKTNPRNIPVIKDQFESMGWEVE